MNVALLVEGEEGEGAREEGEKGRGEEGEVVQNMHNLFLLSPSLVVVLDPKVNRVLCVEADEPRLFLRALIVWACRR